MRITIEWMSLVRVAAGAREQGVECYEGITLNEAPEQASDETGELLRAALFDSSGRVPSLLIAVNCVHIPQAANPTLEPGVTVLVSSPFMRMGRRDRPVHVDVRM